MDPKHPPVEQLRKALSAIQLTCRQERRTDLENVVAIALSRLDRESVLVCVAGQYKHGKSALVNALIGEAVCPVDDDIATSALTALSYSAQPFARAYRSTGGNQTTEDIPLEQIPAFVQEAENSGEHGPVQLVEIGLPNPVLKSGLSLIDTPGVGDFRSEYGAAVRTLLPVVDALIFVADASAELGSVALEFLREVPTACPVLVFVLSKTDMCPEWRRIAELDHQHLANAHLPARVHPISAQLRMLALQRNDVELDRESGFESLFLAIAQEVVHPARDRATRRAVEDAAAVVDQLTQRAVRERQTLEDPAHRTEMLLRLTEAEQRLRELRAASTRWALLLADGFADLRTEVDQMLRALMRTIVEESDQAIQGVDAVGLETLLGSIRTEIAEGIAKSFATIDNRADQVARTILKLIFREEEQLALGDRNADLDLESLTRRALTRQSANGTGKLDWGIGALRGAMGGGYLMAWLGGIAGLTLSAPIALATGAAFAAKFVYEERHRQKERYRQEARLAVRQFVDAVQLEAFARVNQTLTILHRALRDQIQGLLERELVTTSDSVRAIREGLARDDDARGRRIQSLREKVQHLGAIRTELDDLRSAGT